MPPALFAEAYAEFTAPESCEAEDEMSGGAAVCTCAETDTAKTIVFAVCASQALERLVIELVRVLILTEPTRIRWSIQFTNRRER